MVGQGKRIRGEQRLHRRVTSRAGGHMDDEQDAVGTAAGVAVAVGYGGVVVLARVWTKWVCRWIGYVYHVLQARASWS